MLKTLIKIHPNIFIYFSITLFNNFWFITSNWVNYWLKLMTIKDIGVIDALAFGIGLLIEVPSGVISDKLGRKTSLILSNFLQFLGSFIITVSVNRYEIALGFIVFQIGTALFTGTLEAFGYEESSEHNYSYDRLLNFSQYLSNFGYLISLSIGGYFYLINKNIPNFLWSINYLISMILSLLIVSLSSQERLFESPTEKITIQLKNVIHKFNFRTSFYLILLSSITFAFDYGFLKIYILDSFSNQNNNFIYLALITIICLFVSSNLIKKFNNFERIIRISYIFLCLTLIANLYTDSLIFLSFVILNFLTIYIYQISMNYINSRVGDTTRASFISFFSFSYKLPYVLLSILLSLGLEAADTGFILGMLGVFLVIMGFLSKFIEKIVYNRIVSWGRSSVAE